MSKIYPAVDPNGLTEFSVVFNDRSLNHMSSSFQTVMKDISSTLKRCYNAFETIVVPGGGTVGMEAIARQFADDKRCLVLRNGWFSYRWSQIFDSGDIPSEHKALLARPILPGKDSPFAPASLDEAIKEIRTFKPQLVFAAHVETAAGIMLPDDYMKAIAQAVHQEGGLFVLDCIASGAMWVDMEKIGVDVLLSAPQKSWSASPCAALILLSQNAAKQMKERQSSSFALDLNKWRQIMKSYEDGGHAYHATMPTDALAQFHAAMQEIEGLGFAELQQKQLELGSKARRALSERGFRSVAAEGFEAPTVIVSYTHDESIQKGLAFTKIGVQTAAGVPLACKEPADFASFRIGLFGLDKLVNVDATVRMLEEALDKVKANAG